MPAEPTPFAVRVVSPHRTAVEASVPLLRWTPDEVRSRSTRALLLCWAAAPVVAVVPPHIPWLLLALTAGPVAGWLRGRERARVLDASLPCPDCGQAALLETQPVQWPLAVRCRPCGNVLGVEPLDPVSIDISNRR